MQLSDFMGVSSVTQLHSEILLKAGLFGKWKGSCALRDIWGSEFSVTTTCTSHPAEGKNTAALFCFQAAKLSASESADRATTTDHELLHALLETLPDTIYFKDLHSRFIRVNQAMARKNGLGSPTELIGMTDFDRFTIEHAQQAYDNEQQIIRTGEPIIDAVEKETWPDGHITWVSTTKMPLRDAGGHIIGTFGISHDITERKRSEQQHSELLIQLQLAQKLESIGRLAAGVAHEINTPTQFITDNAHFLTQSFEKITQVLETGRSLREAAVQQSLLTAQADAFAAAEQKAELSYLLAEIPNALSQSLEGLGRVARIVQSLKEFSHPQNAQRNPADLNRVISTAITVSRHEWKYVAEVVTDFADTLPPVPCVVDEFNQVILNLLVNAAHAIDSARKEQPERFDQGLITVRTRRDGHWALIEVEDNGTGISDQALPRIFEPFFTTKDIGKGTGQGLSIAHTVIVKKHQGTVNVTTKVGHGTTFHLRLPLSIPSNPPDS
jgi:PAS domain S-box-containing protein